MPFQITRAGVRVPSEDEIERWRREFDRCHCIQLPGFLPPDLLSWVQRRLASAQFHWETHEDTFPPAANLQLSDPHLQLELRTLLNDQRVFDIVEHLSGAGPVGCCLTHVYALDPSPQSRDAWHGDVDGNRRVAISINVGGHYEGGELRIRDKPSARIIHSVANTGDGSAILFRVRDDLEHFVTAITRGRRTAVAGWFQETPRARHLLGLASLIPNP